MEAKNEIKMLKQRVRMYKGSYNWTHNIMKEIMIKNYKLVEENNRLLELFSEERKDIYEDLLKELGIVHDVNLKEDEKTFKPISLEEMTDD